MTTSSNLRYVRAALSCTSALCMLAAGSAGWAQDTTAAAAKDDNAPAIIITGSRIARPDYEANSPIVTAGKNLIENSSTAAIETNLNKMPQFTPVQTPTVASDIQPTATNTPGAATISLRGLGTNRTLVLVDGRRATPGNASMVVDINTLPAAAIDHVEIISGGASATYGADAVAGVVNFILKKNFQGLQVDGQMGVSQYGDGFEYQLGGIMGTNFDDDRGNVSIAFSTNDRKSSKRIDRPWFRSWWQNPNFGGNEYFPHFSGYQPIGANAPAQSAIDNIFGTGVVAGDAVKGVPTGYNSSRFYFNNDGTAFTGFFQSPNGGVSRFNESLTGLKWKKTSNGALAQNFIDENNVLPLNRFNFLARGNYEINDWIGVFAQGVFSKVSTQTLNQPSPSVNGWSVSVPVDGRAIPTELSNILSARPAPTAPWQLTYYLDYANRVANVDVFTYNLQAGFQGKIPGTDWTWEAYGSQGESETNTLLTGATSLERLRAVISAPNWGAGFSAQGNPAFGGFGASSATCTSGFNPFNKDAAISQDCINAVKADLKTRAVLQQTVYEANAQGGLFELPAGQVRGSIGASHRQDRYSFINDTLTTQGTSFLDQSVGIYPSGNSAGIIKADEFYGELLVPVLKDLPGIKKLELELGARSSKYNTTGTSFTWKALADWQVTDWLRFRGGYNKAERSPNIAELYLAPQQTFVFNSSGDLCSLANNGGFRQFSANPTYNPNAAQARTLCETLMNKSIAGTSAKFYADPTFYNTSGGTFAFPTLTGNPNVTPEKADTWTLGAVVSSPFESDLFRRLRLSIDYYNIKVTDAIGAQSVDIAQRQCFDPAFNPTYSATSPYCLGINRVAGDGALGNIITTYFNNGRFKTSGIDTQIDWTFDLGPGRFNLNTVFSYLLSMKTAELASDPLVEYAGTLGPNQNGLNPGAFRWKMLNTFGYSLGAATVSLQWQHLPAIKSATYPGNNATTTAGAPAYDLFNLSGNYAITKDAIIRAGIDNMFNKAPPFTEVNQSPAAGTLAVAAGQSPINAVLYDTIGRRFYVGATFKF